MKSHKADEKVSHSQHKNLIKRKRKLNMSFASRESTMPVKKEGLFVGFVFVSINEGGHLP